MKSCAVVGGGFRGIIAAHFLAKAKCAVTLVEQAQVLGGVLYSSEWNGFYLDKGCHLFDNDGDELTDIMHEILDGEIIDVRVKYASVTDGIKSDGVAIPDFTFLDQATQERMLFEVVAACADPVQYADTLAELLHARFGPTVAGRLCSAASKMLQADPVDLDAASFSSTPFDRIRIVPDRLALILKQSPELDQRIAASSELDPLKFYRSQAKKYAFRNFYPRGKGMRSFCEASLTHLERLGVNVVLGQSVDSLSADTNGIQLGLSGGDVLQAEYLVWGMDLGTLSQVMFGENPLKHLVHPVPMVLYYFKCRQDQAGDYTYIHDFSEHSLIFRASTPGIYGQQIDSDGNTFVCFEVPTKPGSHQWTDPEKYLGDVWREAQSLGVVNGEQAREYSVVRAPVTYKVPKKGFRGIQDTTIARVRNCSSRVIISDQSSFSKGDIVRSLQEFLPL